jgi:hypothetical protein
MRLPCLVRKTIQHLSRAPPVAMLWSTRLLHFVFFVPSGSIHHCVGVGADTKARQSERRDWGHFGAAANQFAFSTIGDVAFAAPVRGHCTHHGSAVLRGLFTSSCFPSSSAPYPFCYCHCPHCLHIHRAKTYEYRWHWCADTKAPTPVFSVDFHHYGGDAWRMATAGADNTIKVRSSWVLPSCFCTDHLFQ